MAVLWICFQQGYAGKTFVFRVSVYYLITDANVGIKITESSLVDAEYVDNIALA